MHTILQELAEFVGQEWAWRWLDHLQRTKKHRSLGTQDEMDERPDDQSKLSMKRDPHEHEH